MPPVVLVALHSFFWGSFFFFLLFALLVFVYEDNHSHMGEEMLWTLVDTTWYWWVPTHVEPKHKWLNAGIVYLDLSYIMYLYGKYSEYALIYMNVNHLYYMLCFLMNFSSNLYVFSFLQQTSCQGVATWIDIYFLSSRFLTSLESPLFLWMRIFNSETCPSGLVRLMDDPCIMLLCIVPKWG